MQAKMLFEYWLPEDYDKKIEKYLAHGFEIIKEDKEKIIIKKKKAFGWIGLVMGTIVFGLIFGWVGAAIILLISLLIYEINTDQIRTLYKK